MDVFIRHPCRLSTKSPRDEMAGDEVSLRRNGWRQSVPATKCQATKCPCDEMAGDKCPRDEMVGDEKRLT